MTHLNGIFMVAMLIIGGLIFNGAGSARANDAADIITAIETRLDMETGCVAGGVSTERLHQSCHGLGGYGVALASEEGRVSLFFGHLGPWYLEGAWESFDAENAASAIVEWRLVDGEPFAAIQRWRVFHAGHDPEQTGEVLVISKVGQPGIGEACVTAYVDAKANEDALDIARDIADNQAARFQCRVNAPVYHGIEGLLSGFPVRTFGP